MQVRLVATCLLFVLLCPLASALDHNIAVPATESTSKPFMLALYHLNGEGSVEPDYTSNMNDGVVFGTTSVSGQFENARKFTSTDFIGITNKNFSVGYNISLSMFVYLPSFPGGRASLWSATDDENSTVWFGLNLTKLQFQVKDTKGKVHDVKASTSLTLRKWTYITAIFNGYDNYMGISMNGNETVGGHVPTGTGNFSATSNSRCIGNKTCIHPLTYSTIVMGASYTNETIEYFTGSIDEVAVYDGDLAYLNILYSKPPPPVPPVSKDTSKYVLVGLAILGICLFVLIILMSRQMSFNLRSPMTAALVSLLVGVSAGACLAFAYPPLCGAWGLMLLIAGFALLTMFALIKANQVDLMGNKIEQSLPMVLPVLGLVLVALGAVDACTGVLTALGRPFWLA
jgi:hypothetical protein